MELIQKLRNFLTRESKYEDEAEGLLLLIRTVILICLPVYIGMFIYSLIFSLGIKPVVTLLAGVVIYAGIFAATYFHRSRKCMIALIVSTIIISGILTTIFGWRASFQNIIYIVLLIMWYDPTTGQKRKVLWSVVLGVSICYISHKTTFGVALIPPESMFYSVVVYANIIVFSICISIVAYYFCNQYIESEHKLREYARKLKQLSETDPLTKLVNRRYTEEELEEVRKDSMAQNYMFCIAIGDIDFFKHINDTYGHDAGDFILSSLAQDFKSFIKGKGFVARWGGEEFLFILRRMNGDEAMIQLDQLRTSIKNKEYVYKGTSIKITMTFGIDEFSDSDGIKKTIDNADKKLYMGKESGRDRVVF